MSEFLRLLGYDPQYYWLLSGACVLLWLGSAALPHLPAGGPLQRLNRPIVFGLTLLLAMFACRWPTFFFRAVNPDEAQFLAGAITMLARHEFWWTDTGTSGPLVVLPLAVLGLFGLPINYASARVVALLLQWGTIFMTYQSVRHIYGDRLARLLVLPLGCQMVFLMFWDLVPYCSEVTPVCLCALAIWLCLTAFRTEGVLCNRWRLAGGGLILGLLPFSKLQVLPLGAAIGFSALVWVLAQPQADRRMIRRDLLLLIASVISSFALLLLCLWNSGFFADFFESFVVQNFHYTQARFMPWTSSAYTLSYLTKLIWGFASFHYGMLLLLAPGVWYMRRAPWRPLLLGWTLLFTAYYAVLAPGRLFPHYMNLLPLPLALLVGLSFGHAIQSAVSNRRLTIALWTLFFAAGVGVQTIDRGFDRHQLGKLAQTSSPQDSLANFINQTKRPGDTLTVWGWRPDIYVDTQLPQATREAHTYGQMQESSQRDYYRTRFLADLRQNQPAFFVDVVGPADFGHLDASREGHETFPALKEYIAKEYSLVSKTEPIRVYVRRTLLGTPN